MIDIHTHILPEIDDGSKNVDESIAMLDALSKQGVDTVVATPHFYIDRIDVRDFLKRRTESFEKLKKSLDKLVDRPQIALGAEVQFYPELSSLDGIERFCIGETKYLLVEMPFVPWNGYTYQTINHLSMSRGIIPVIAHIERYIDFMNEKKTVLKLKEAGALIQINSSFIIDRGTRRKALSFLKQNTVSFIASDCHNLESRPPNIEKSFEIIYKKLGDSGFELLRYREAKLKKHLVTY